jgi:hypothetical protein
MQPDILLQVGKIRLDVQVVVCMAPVLHIIAGLPASPREQVQCLARCNFCNPTWLSSHGPQGVTM